MTLKELVERTGLEPRMVRYLIAQELVPRALATGLGSDPYGPQHVEAIGRVQALLNLGYKVPTIKRLLSSNEALVVAATDSLEVRLKPGADLASIDIEATLDLIRNQLTALVPSPHR